MTQIIIAWRVIEKKTLTLFKRHIYIKWNYAKLACEPSHETLDRVQTERQRHSPRTWSVQLHYVMRAGMHSHTRTEPRQRFSGWGGEGGWTHRWSYLMCGVIMWNWVLNRTLHNSPVKRDLPLLFLRDVDSCQECSGCHFQMSDLMFFFVFVF